MVPAELLGAAIEDRTAIGAGQERVGVALYVQECGFGMVLRLPAPG
jgi:hypothetical protein